MALCTNPPSPLVGDVERARSGDIRRCVGDGGIGSSAGASACGGSNFGAPDNATGETVAAAGDTEETLERWWLELLSPTVEAVLGGEGDFSLTSSSRSGSTVDSRLIPGSLRLGPRSAWFSSRSSGFRNAGEPNPRSAVWRNQAGSLDDNELATWARDS